MPFHDPSLSAYLDIATSGRTPRHVTLFTGGLIITGEVLPRHRYEALLAVAFRTIDRELVEERPDTLRAYVEQLSEDDDGEYVHLGKPQIIAEDGTVASTWGTPWRIRLRDVTGWAPGH